MNASNNEITNQGGPVSSAEPSMEEILASIRRILREEQVPTPQEPKQEDEILVLDSSMIVNPSGDGGQPAAPESPIPEPAAPESIAPEPAGVQQAPAHLASALPVAELPEAENETLELPQAENEEKMVENSEPDAPAGARTDGFGHVFHGGQAPENIQPPPGLVSEAASHAASNAIGSLIRSISSERAVAIGRPGITLEDLVREELRPLLKSWLDSNLPSLVERIVRAEIQRVVERTET